MYRVRADREVRSRIDRIRRHDVHQRAELVLVVPAHVVGAAGVEPLVRRHEVAGRGVDVDLRRQDDAAAQVSGQHHAAGQGNKSRHVAHHAQELLCGRRAQQSRRPGHRRGENRAADRVEWIVHPLAEHAQRQGSLQPPLLQLGDLGRVTRVEKGAERCRIGRGGAVGEPVREGDGDVGSVQVRDRHRRADFAAQVHFELAVLRGKHREHQRVGRTDERIAPQRGIDAVVGNARADRIAEQRTAEIVLQAEAEGITYADLGHLGGHVEYQAVIGKVAGGPFGAHAKAVVGPIADRCFHAMAEVLYHAHGERHDTVRGGVARGVDTDRRHAIQIRGVQAPLRLEDLVEPVFVARPRVDQRRHVRRVDAERRGHPDRAERRMRTGVGHESRVRLVGATRLVDFDGGARIAVVPQAEGDRIGGLVKPVIRGDVPHDDRQVLSDLRRLIDRIDADDVEAHQAVRLPFRDPEGDVDRAGHPLDDGVDRDIRISAALEDDLQPVDIPGELELVEVPLVAEPQPAQQGRTGEQAGLRRGNGRGKKVRVDSVIALEMYASHQQRHELTVRRPGRCRDDQGANKRRQPSAMGPRESCD